MFGSNLTDLDSLSVVAHVVSTDPLKSKQAPQPATTQPDVHARLAILMEQEAAETARERRRSKRLAIMISLIAIGLFVAVIALSLVRRH